MSTKTQSVPAETPDGLPLPSPVQPDPLSMGAVIRILPMRRMWYAQIVSVLGDFLALFAVIEVMTFKLHATPQQVTGLQIAYLLPIAVLGQAVDGTEGTFTSVRHSLSFRIWTITAGLASCLFSGSSSGKKGASSRG